MLGCFFKGRHSLLRCAPHFWLSSYSRRPIQIVKIKTVAVVPLRGTGFGLPLTDMISRRTRCILALVLLRLAAQGNLFNTAGAAVLHVFWLSSHPTFHKNVKVGAPIQIIKSRES